MDPFRIFGRVVLATFRIAGYFSVSIVQIIWYVAHMRRDKLGDVIGDFGRSSVDAVADIFR